MAGRPERLAEEQTVKLRLLDDSIRLRLSRSEVVAAAENGSVEAQTRFPDGSVFIFALESTPGGKPESAFAGGRMTVRLPRTEIVSWAGDDNAVSLQGELGLPEGGSLSVLVEKDFRCVTPREGEDQSDLFPNPEVSC